MRPYFRFLIAGILVPLTFAADLHGQAQPKSFKELRVRIDGSKRVDDLIESINLIYKYRSSSTREYLCKALAIYRDTEVRCAIYKQMGYHPHADILKQLRQGFRPGTSAKELDAIVAALSGQGRGGQKALAAGLTSKDKAIRSRSISGLRKARDPDEAALSLLRIYDDSDARTKAQILSNVVAMPTSGTAFARVESLAFRVMEKERSASLRVPAMRQLRGGKTKLTNRAFLVLMKEFGSSKSVSLIRESAKGLLTHDRRGLLVLLGGLESESTKRRDAAIAVLGSQRSNRKVTAALIEQFQIAKPKLQETLLGILAHHEASAPLTALRVRTLDSESASMRAQALLQLARTDHRVVGSKALEFAEDKEIRKNANATAQVFLALGTVLTRSTLSTFLDLGRNRGREVEAYWRSLLSSHHAEVLPLITKWSPSLKDPDQRLIAVYLLTKSKVSKAKSKNLVESGLIKALADKSSIVVVTAMRALIRQGNKRVIPKLESNLESMDEDVRIQAMLGLHRFKSGSVVWGARLLRILQNTGGASRLVALDLITKIKLRPALNAVRGLFDHEAWQVRSAAYFYCLQVRDKASIAPLITRLDKEDGRLHAEVLGTLRALTNLTHRESKQWRAWWRDQGEDFKMPSLRKVAGVGRSAPAAMTYYSMSLSSNRVGFLVDTSGSMSAKVGTSAITRLDLAKKALSQVIEKCGEGFHFNLITFGSDARRWKRELCPATIDNRDQARQYVKGMRPGGGTNFFDALLMAFEDESIDTIYLLSDGTPTEGDIRDQQELADEVQLWNLKRQILIHTISIGADSAVMRRLAEDSGGDHVQRR